MTSQYESVVSVADSEEAQNFDKYQQEYQEIKCEEQLVRLLDLRMLPVIVTVYFFGICSRINISNIYTELVEEVGFSGFQYSLLATIFFFGFSVFNLPSNLALKRTGAPFWLALSSVLWSIISVSCILTTSFPVWAVLRALLGSVQAGVFPGILFFVSYWYKPNESGLRITIIFSASLMAGSISGALAYLILPSMDGALGLSGWQWFLLIENSPAFFIGIFVWFYLPKDPKTCKWLSEEKRELAIRRLYKNSDDIVDDLSIDKMDEDLQPLLDTNNERTRELFKEYDDNNTLAVTQTALTNVTIWMFSLTYLCICVPNAAINFFLPQIVKLLDPEMSNVFANLITSPLYLVATVSAILISRSSDRRMERSLHIIIPLCVSGVGFIGLSMFAPGGLVNKSGTSIVLPLIFAAMAVLGATPVIPIFCTWLTNIVPKEQPCLLAVATSMMVTVGQLAGIVAPQLYPGMNMLYQKVNNVQCISSPTGACKMPDNYAYAHLAVGLVLLLAITGAVLLRQRLNASASSTLSSNRRY